MKENTVYRWNEALKRGREEGLRVRTISDLHEDHYLVDSGSCAGQVYEVTQYGWCSCEAAKHGDPVCKHRAILLKDLGRAWPVTPNIEGVAGVRSDLIDALTKLRRIEHGR